MIGNEPILIGPNDGLPGIEASLDIEYISSVANGATTTVWSTGGLHEGQENFLVWLVNVSSDPTPPLLFSVSYGDDESSLDLSYMQRVDAEFQKAALRGITILFASGDSGVGCQGQGKGQQFNPSYPATSVYVTAVGGTTTGTIHSSDEFVNGLSGGGFSNVFSTPSWQAEAVSTYLSTASDLPDASFYNASGRGYPDISALSQGFVVVIDLAPTPGVAGTSCAAPTAGGVLTL